MAERRVVDLLRDKKLLTEDIKMVNYHMNLLKCTIEDLSMKVPELKGKNEDEIAAYVVNAFSKCDERNPEYDFKLDQEMTRIGLKTDDFYSDEWCPKLDREEKYGSSQTATQLYDDYVDAVAEIDHMRK